MSIATSQTTRNFVAAHNKLVAKKISERFFASGIVVSLKDLSGNEICEDFCIHGEFFDGVQMALIEALEKVLQRREESLRSELNSVLSVKKDT